MKLTRIRISNFQSFGPSPTTITFAPTTFLLGPNGSGKTAVLQALARLFAVDFNLRKVQRSDFYVSGKSPKGGQKIVAPDEQKLWIEAEFEFQELAKPEGKHSTIPSHFAHMRLGSKGSVAIIRLRLDAALDAEGEVDQELVYVLEEDKDGLPVKTSVVPKDERNTIQVHYLPVRRDPVDQISYSTSSLLGRVLRAAAWNTQSGEISTLTAKINQSLCTNAAVAGLNGRITTLWKNLNRGTFFNQPNISFERNEIESLLRHLTLGFSPGHDQNSVDFSRLGDGHKSLLYVCLVLAVQSLGRQVLSGELTGWDVKKLKPAIFTLVAVEEPENSLSPHFLGRLIKTLTELGEQFDGQAIIATHSPALLRRVPPEAIRYLRLNQFRTTDVKNILMPPEADEAHKFVREAVQAYPELYFSRLVILGEGDSEEIVIPRMLHARGKEEDSISVAVVPLGGRHVNHFWRLLTGLDIPYVTLLDLDLARHQGGWGRLRYAATQLRAFSPLNKEPFSKAELEAAPRWGDGDEVLNSAKGKDWMSGPNAYVFFTSHRQVFS